MSTTLRIEELKKKFDENPRRYFAPLANEYRKAGDLQQAISICQAHLPQQPGHMSGHIVYGQALFEARQFDQARTVFETALALDPENLIALRYLGDIAFELGDRSVARGWYTRVLETDPRNEEIAALMAAMGEDRTQRESGPTAAPPSAAPAAPQPASTEAAAAPAQGAERVRGPESQAGGSAPGGDADAELEKLFAKPSQSGPSSPAADAALPAQPPGSFSPLTGFAGGTSADAPPSLDQPAPSLSASTFAAQRGDDAPLQNPPSLDRGDAATGASRSGDAPPDAGFVTETMAELYIKQGFHDRALAVYEQLVAQNPNDRALRERMERVARDVKNGSSAWGGGFGGSGAAARATRQGGSAGGRAGPTVRQFLAQIGSRRAGGRGPGVSPPPGGGPRNSGEFRAPQEQAARASSSGSIDALFGGAPPSGDDAAAASTLADAFSNGGGAVADAQVGGRPAHPAATELSLDHVFRDGAPSGGRGSAVSYDQFFSQPASSGAPNAGEPPASMPPTSGSDDIEQFNAWLQGLKKR
jgi:tetratricopeptide (TPR) repeat protein